MMQNFISLITSRVTYSSNIAQRMDAISVDPLVSTLVFFSSVWTRLVLLEPDFVLNFGFTVFVFLPVRRGVCFHKLSDCSASPFISETSAVFLLASMFD